MNDFWKGLLIAGAAPIVFSFVPWAAFLAPGEGLGILLLMAWFLAPVAFIVTLIVGLTSRVFRTAGGRAGVLTGLGLAVVTMGTSCFALRGGF